MLIEIILAVLECANCSLHVTVGGALSETIATVLLSLAVPAVLSFASGEADAWGKTVILPYKVSVLTFQLWQHTNYV